MPSGITGFAGEYDKRVKLTLDGLGLHRDMRVLDIGSGPGTLALPMAAHVREVTALDSSEGMLSLLREHADRKGIGISGRFTPGGRTLTRSGICRSGTILLSLPLP
jgi:cyclopropane fatty-acyl-phospholipid synthase-like methyltransferase